MGLFVCAALVTVCESARFVSALDKVELREMTGSHFGAPYACKLRRLFFGFDSRFCGGRQWSHSAKPTGDPTSHGLRNR
jgi:hypothetical protein